MSVFNNRESIAIPVKLLEGYFYNNRESRVVPLVLVGGRLFQNRISRVVVTKVSNVYSHSGGKRDRVGRK
jgi:hypothetical protein